MVPICYTGTIPYGMRARFPGAHVDSRSGAGDRCCGRSTHGRLAGPATFNKGSIDHLVSVPLFAIYDHQHNERSHARCRDFALLSLCEGVFKGNLGKLGLELPTGNKITVPLRNGLGSAAERLLPQSSGHRG